MVLQIILAQLIHARSKHEELIIMMHMWDLLSIFFLFLVLYHEKLEFD